MSGTSLFRDSYVRDSIVRDRFVRDSHVRDSLVRDKFVGSATKQLFSDASEYVISLNSLFFRK